MLCTVIVFLCLLLVQLSIVVNRVCSPVVGQKDDKGTVKEVVEVETVTVYLVILIHESKFVCHLYMNVYDLTLLVRETNIVYFKIIKT